MNKETILEDNEWGKLVKEEDPEAEFGYNLFILNSWGRKTKIHPQCRPMKLANGELQVRCPQEINALNALASTYNMTGDQYLYKLEQEKIEATRG